MALDSRLRTSARYDRRWMQTRSQIHALGDSMDGNICSVEGCERTQHGVYHTLCRPHYERNLRARQRERAARGLGRLCSVDGCANPHDANGMCTKHRIRALRAGRPKEPKVKVEKPPCGVAECEKVSTSAGYCSGHYSNLRRHGEPVHPEPRGGTPLERFARRVEADDELGCWLWSGTLNDDLYGKFYAGQRREVRAHRWFYQEMTGRQLPRSIQLDHGCNVRHCVRPAHLDEVTPAEHNARTRARRAAEVAGMRHQPNEKARSWAEIGFAIEHRLPMAWNK